MTQVKFFFTKGHMELQGGERCVYCGFFANVRDHVIPLAFLTNKERKEAGFRGNDNIVPACSECNSIANDKVFESLEEKRDFIPEVLARKYRKLMKMPKWNEEELSLLDSNLKKYVTMQVKAKEIIENRIRWPYNYYSLYMFSDDVFGALFS